MTYKPTYNIVRAKRTSLTFTLSALSTIRESFQAPFQKLANFLCENSKTMFCGIQQEIEGRNTFKITMVTYLLKGDEKSQEKKYLKKTFQENDKEKDK